MSEPLSSAPARSLPIRPERYCSELAHFPRLVVQRPDGGRMPVDWLSSAWNVGTTNNGTILDFVGKFLLDEMTEVPEQRQGRPGQGHRVPRRVRGPDSSDLPACRYTSVRAIGLDTPGPASADGASTSSKGRDQLRDAGWRGFDIRGALAEASDPGHLQQRRERGRAVRASRPVRRGVSADRFGFRHRRHLRLGQQRAASARAAGSSRARPGWRENWAMSRSPGRPAGPGPADVPSVRLRAAR